MSCQGSSSLFYPHSYVIGSPAFFSHRSPDCIKERKPIERDQSMSWCVLDCVLFENMVYSLFSRISQNSVNEIIHNIYLKSHPLWSRREVQPVWIDLKSEISGIFRKLRSKILRKKYALNVWVKVTMSVTMLQCQLVKLNWRKLRKITWIQRSY